MDIVPNSIQQYMKNNNIELFILPKTDCYYSIEHNTIYINKERHKQSIVPIILHELGHSIDRLKLIELEVDWFLYNSQSFDRKQIKLEVSAWRNAKYLAKKLEIKLDTNFFSVMKTSLKSYLKNRKRYCY